MKGLKIRFTFSWKVGRTMGKQQAAPSARVLISNIAKFNVVAPSLAVVLRIQKMLFS